MKITDADSIASIAKEAGFEITADEVKKAQSTLPDEPLDLDAGGANSYPTVNARCRSNPDLR
ncbi:Nif11-like leader peptide family RiPP precursor [Prochlorococcus marinus]|uniref:Nif11 domain-containing protein n=1 Tax=Prochlorococcus marinus (strain MIT 9303) TaxID=59922 RepID=A2CDY4_PROM3|nr:Nif11-like leader peptide family RiPP precursor [Prochlorococcus marinus]ABM79694.1 Hypothetical protein P9303_29641 [Prochlorococcus marinus str. MIT 9303]